MVLKGSTCLYLAFFRLQATKALGKNAGVLGGSIMVGVAPCRDESVLDALNTRSGAVSEKAYPLLMLEGPAMILSLQHGSWHADSRHKRG